MTDFMHVADADGVLHVRVRTKFNYDRDTVSEATGLYCDDKSLTQQNFAEECDINTIVRRFGLTGQLPDNVRTPEYKDYEGVFDFQSAMNAVRNAGEAFMELPAEIRARFHNEPQEFLEFCANPDNRDEAVKLGLVKAREVAVPPVPVVPPAEPPKEA